MLDPSVCVCVCVCVCEFTLSSKRKASKSGLIGQVLNHYYPKWGIETTFDWSMVLCLLKCMTSIFFYLVKFQFNLEDCETELTMLNKICLVKV